MNNTLPYVHSQAIHNTSAAEVILPLIKRLVGFNSVIDFGCGLGSWLKVAEDLGAKKVLGVDGGYVPKELLYIDQAAFLERDLRLPLEHLGKFDLAICLEVAEHLPFSISDEIVRFLSESADHILFSAAMPQQLGQNHINEQWPEFWADKFRQRGFYTYDFLRPLIWQNDAVEWWYKQNVFFLSRENFQASGILPDKTILPIIHPDNYADKMVRLSNYQQGKVPIKSAFAVLAKKILNWKSS
jgi:SAM-dependent methyltransferase